MPVRKLFDNFEDPHGYYSILGYRKLSSDKEFDATFKKEKKNISSNERKSHPENLRGNPDKENFTKLKEKYEWAHNAYKKCQRAYEILGDVKDDGTYMKRVNYKK